jgi:hypothetical protein
MIEVGKIGKKAVEIINSYDDKSLENYENINTIFDPFLDLSPEVVDYLFTDQDEIQDIFKNAKIYHISGSDIISSAMIKIPIEKLKRLGYNPLEFRHVLSKTAKKEYRKLFYIDTLVDDGFPSKRNGSITIVITRKFMPSLPKI